MRIWFIFCEPRPTGTVATMPGFVNIVHMLIMIPTKNTRHDATFDLQNNNFPFRLVAN